MAVRFEDFVKTLSSTYNKSNKRRGKIRSRVPQIIVDFPAKGICTSVTPRGGGGTAVAAVVRRRDTIAVLVRRARFRQHYSGWPISLTGVLWAHHHLVFLQTFCETPSIWDIVHRMPPRFGQKPLL